MIRRSRPAAERQLAETGDLMQVCRNGHANPANWDRCGECGVRLGRGGVRALLMGRPQLWTVIATAAAVAAVVAGIIGAVLYMMPAASDNAEDPVQSPKDATELWWSGARHEVDDLRSALADTKSAIQAWDRSSFNDACRRMHDAAAVGVPAHLPAPDPVVTAELSAAAEDAHSAAHMCLSVFENSVNNYDGEFTTALEEATKHAEAAQVLVDLKLST